MSDPRRALIDMAIAHLKCARTDLHMAGAARACNKVRAALKSAEGAARHAQGMAERTDNSIDPAILNGANL